eukprot:CAMPEP_0181210104 /NCGR_PEP_ID=MMETSP1096-20121128/23043_1 /TAXON_ID=156174 ORGANISM="Chrysochromulina ericina, Strain CCMP281" /NCGR_SAMPLE_ID=MMETSP1096 /ASSEMBLY_ACC=CAM_ASM_000453 /LENGTH=141 /DNA_ID=CAMNT_0023301353 /DNA_START=215 /DNA_END=641 /DNA_ORIENTATION=+
MVSHTAAAEHIIVWLAGSWMACMAAALAILSATFLLDAHNFCCFRLIINLQSWHFKQWEAFARQARKLGWALSVTPVACKVTPGNQHDATHRGPNDNGNDNSDPSSRVGGNGGGYLMPLGFCGDQSHTRKVLEHRIRGRQW